MTESADHPHFACPGCGQRFAWKPAYAGRKVTCRCGHAFTPSPEQDDETYDLRADSKPPPIRTAPAAPRLEYQSPDRAVVARRHESAAAPSRLGLKELALPLVLAFTGLLFWLGTRFFDPAHTGRPLLSWIVLSALWIVLSVVLMLLSLQVAARMADIQLDGLGPTIAKLSMIAVAGTVAFALGASMDRDGSLAGYVMAFNIVLIVYGVMFSGLFGLDFQETALTVALVAILQAVAAAALLRPWW